MSLSPSPTLTEPNDLHRELPGPQELAVHSNVSSYPADDSDTQRDLTPTQDGTMTTVPSTRSVTLTISRSDFQGSNHSPPSEASQTGEPCFTDGREITTYDQSVSQYSGPNTLRDQRKRTRTLDPSDLAHRPSKRRPVVDNDVLPGEDRESFPDSEGNPGRLLTDNQAVIQTGSGFFSNANNVMWKDVKVQSQQIYVQNSPPDNAVLQWLKKHAMHGAEHDSADRDPPPRCHPGTRTTIIQNFQDWLGNSERGKNLLWLQGPAGVGKSAIIQTIAEILFDTGRLGASLFFSRTNGHTNPRQIFPTLAYRFAVQDPSYKECMAQLMRTDPESLNKTMSEQFRLLIVDPFALRKIRSGSEVWVVALDGLDECGSGPNNKLHSNHVQRDIVRLISGFVQKYPTAPLTWVIASRPEAHLKAVFSEPDVVASFWEEEVPVDSNEACQDVEKYLQKEFTKISQSYPDHIHQSTWPTSKQFLAIAQAALGLFIFAEVVIRFIDDPDVGNPIAQLERALLVISKLRPNKNQEKPLANLDAMYIEILSRTPPSTLPITNHLLGFLMFLNTKDIRISDCNLRLVWNILDISADTAVTALRHLHSVIYFPKVKDIGRTRPRFYHASFRDFLRDKSRSDVYFVNEETVVTKIIQGTARVAQTGFTSKPIPPSLTSSGGEHEGTTEYFITEFLERVFRGDFSPKGVELSFYDIADCLPDVQLQSLLENLSVVEVMKRAGGAFNALMYGQKQRSKRELSRREFISETTVGNLGINWDIVSLSISELRGFQLVQVEHDITSTREDDLTVQEARLFFKTAAPSTKAMILGHKKSDRCIIVSPGHQRYLGYVITQVSSLAI